MKKTVIFIASVVFMLTILGIIQIPLAHSEPMLKMVSIKANAPGQINKLARMGIDISEVVKGPVVKGAADPAYPISPVGMILRMFITRRSQPPTVRIR